MTEISRENDHVPGSPAASGELWRTFGKIGLLSFGGPAGQIALMHQVLVEEKKWLDEKRFLHAMNFCMLLPGPEAMQLATYCGWLLRGVAGGILAGLLFILPGLLVLLILSATYASAGDVPVVQSIFFGLKAAVLAIVVQALVRLSRRTITHWAGATLALFAFACLFFLQLPFPAVIFSALLIGYAIPAMFHASIADDPETVVNHRSARAATIRRHTISVALWAVIFWGVPLLVLRFLPGITPIYADQALFFSKAAMVTFGGAYAVLTYVGQQAVEIYQWLTPGEMLAGLGLAETTPGPLILVLVFVGFMGGYRAAEDALLSGLGGGLVAAFFTFVPCFIWIFLGAPFMERLRGNQRLAGALAAITAAVVGVIGNLSLWFAFNVLFSEIFTVTLGPASVDLPIWTSLNFWALVLAVTAGLLLFFKWSLFIVLAVNVAVAALIGAAGLL